MIKYYGPNPNIISYVEYLCKDKTKILELGPGFTPFSKATHFCGWDQGEKKSVSRGQPELYPGSMVLDLANREPCSPIAETWPMIQKIFDSLITKSR
jgi:hypothetical protein